MNLYCTFACLTKGANTESTLYCMVHLIGSAVLLLVKRGAASAYNTLGKDRTCHFARHTHTPARTHVHVPRNLPISTIRRSVQIARLCSQVAQAGDHGVDIQCAQFADTKHYVILVIKLCDLPVGHGKDKLGVFCNLLLHKHEFF